MDANSSSASASSSATSPRPPAFRFDTVGGADTLAGLGDREKEALVLRVQESLGAATIADRLGVSEAEASATLDRAFDRLRGLAPSEVSR